MTSGEAGDPGEGRASILVIRGAGVAGRSAAKAARAAAPSANVILVTSEASLPYFRPDLSKSYLSGDRDEPSPIASPDDLRDADIELITDWTVETIDLKEKRLCGAQRDLRFDRLLLASGATAVRPKIAGLTLPGIFQLRTAAEASLLRQALIAAENVAIVGGGLIGLEIASTAHGLGKHVTVIEKAPRPLARILPEALSAIVADHHRAQGVRLMVNTDVLRFAGDHSVEAVETSEGCVKADLVVVAVGAKPDTRLAEAAGLACRDGILVDQKCRTSHPDVFAAGDVARTCDNGEDYRLEAWRHAERQGAVAGTNLAGGDICYTASPWFWSDQGPLHIQGCGYLSDNAQAVVRLGEDARSRLMFQVEHGRLQAGFCISLEQAFGKDIAFLPHLVALQPKVDAEMLADRALPLKALLRTFKSTAE
jgi:3-phenylpropionate/trans-cinnamate dioxygenase ferredoxin reductase subunit